MLHLSDHLACVLWSVAELQQYLRHRIKSSITVSTPTLSYTVIDVLQRISEKFIDFGFPQLNRAAYTLLN